MNPDDRIIFAADVAFELGFQDTKALNYQISRGRFPPAEGLVGNRRYWRVGVVREARERMLTPGGKATMPPSPAQYRGC
jgi:hypothetical protein